MFYWTSSVKQYCICAGVVGYMHEALGMEISSVLIVFVGVTINTISHKPFINSCLFTFHVGYLGLGMAIHKFITLAQKRAI